MNPEGCKRRKRVMTQPLRILAAGKSARFVGRAFRHDKKAVFSSGVLIPEGFKTHFFATCIVFIASRSVPGCGLYFYAERPGPTGTWSTAQQRDGTKFYPTRNLKIS